MRTYCCQFDVAWEDKDENFKRVRSLLNRRKLASRSLVVLPEMFATGFSMNSGATAEPANGPTFDFLRTLARDKGVFVLGGLARLAAPGRIFNEAVCIAPSGRPVARYDKLHLFSPGDESRHYAPGGAITLFRWEGLKVAVFICYDLRFPEVFRLAVGRGANVLVVIANWPGKRQAHWTALLRARAIENQAYVIGVNRCGRDPSFEYGGGSLVVDPWGGTVAEAGGVEALLPAKLDPAALKRVRAGFPVLRDIRTRLSLENTDGELEQRS